MNEAPSNLAIIDHYVMTLDIFDRIDETEPSVGGEIQLTDTLQKLDSIYRTTFEEKTYDMRITEPEQLYKLKAILPNDFNKYYIRLTPTLNHQLL